MLATPRSSALAAFAAVLAGSTAAAQITFEENGLTGETSVAGTAKTGNTESTDLGLGLKLRHETARWRQVFGGTYDWGRANDEATKNRLATSYELARLFHDRLYGFGRAAYELDELGGFDYRAVVGGGLGLDILTGEQRSWSLQGGPAYRIDEVEPAFDDMGVLLAPGETQTSLAGNLGSRFFAQLNDAVSFRNDTDVTSSVDTTTFHNTAALTADLLGSVSARFSFDVLHDTSPPPAAESTDTTTRAALVYSFGED